MITLNLDVAILLPTSKY